MEDEKQEAKLFTYRDLKTELDKLNDEQLSQPVRWWGDEKGGVIKGLDILEEDWCEDDIYLTPRSVMEKVNEGLPDEDKWEVLVKLPKGTPLLSDESDEDIKYQHGIG